MTGYRQVRQPFVRETVLHQLEGAANENQEREAANGFREWVDFEESRVTEALDAEPCGYMSATTRPRSIQHTTTYTQLSAAPFKDSWR